MARKKKKSLKSAQVAEQIKDVAEANPYVKILVYGRNGKGKTRFAASAPKVLIIDVNEKGTRSARSFKGVKVIEISNWHDLAGVYWYLKKGDHDFQSVAIDTLTGLQALCMDQVLYEGYERDQTKDPKTPTKRDWGTTAKLMGEEIHKFRNLPMNVIFTAQERVTGDPEEGEPILVTADLPNGARTPALAAVEVIGRVYKQKVKNKKTKKSSWKFLMQVGDHEEYDTKDRTYSLGNILVEPSVPKIIKASVEE